MSSSPPGPAEAAVSPTKDLADDHPESAENQARRHLKAVFALDTNVPAEDIRPFIDVSSGQCVSRVENPGTLKAFLEGVVHSLVAAGSFWETFEARDVEKAVNLTQAVRHSGLVSCITGMLTLIMTVA
jgi:hypothetical protein